MRITGDLVLSDLHQVIQELFDWDDAHLWQFEFGNDLYSPDDDEFDDMTPRGKTHSSADETILADALGRRKKFSYTVHALWQAIQNPSLLEW